MLGITFLGEGHNQEPLSPATELSTGSVVNALKFLEQQGHLERSVDRGPGAARRVVDGDQLLDAYATAAETLRSSVAIRVGVLWRDPVAGVVELGRQWDAAGVAWAVTSAVSASLQAPLLTEVSPWEIYVEGKTFSTVRRAASLAGLREIDGGRLILRPFPTPAAAKLTEPIADGLRSVLWPRTYADLRISGVRGDEAADHLREEMTRE